MLYISFEVHHNELHNKIKITLKRFFFNFTFVLRCANFCKIFCIKQLGIAERGGSRIFSREGADSQIIVFRSTKLIFRALSKH